MAEINTQLLKDTMDYIKAHPDQHYQNAWRCSSGMCFAGTAAILAGGTWVTSAGHETLGDMLVATDADDPDDIVNSKHFDKTLGDVPMVDAAHRARMVLGIDEDVADALFSGGNTVEVLDHIVELLTSGDPCAQQDVLDYFDGGS